MQPKYWLICQTDHGTQKIENKINSENYLFYKIKVNSTNKPISLETT